MIIRIILITIISLWHGLVFGNNIASTDSFVAKANRSTLTDSVEYLIHLSVSDMQQYPARAFNNAQTAKKIATQVRLKYQSALASKQMGEAKLITEEYYEAEKHLLEAEQYFTPKSPNIRGDICYLLAKTKYYLSDYQQSIDLYIQALKLFKSTGNQVMVANIYQHLGILYFDINDLEKSKYYNSKSLKINTELENNTNVAELHQNMGIIHYKKNEYKKALSCFEKSIAIFKSRADTQNIATAYSNIGLVQLGQKKYQSAYSSFERSKDLFIATGYPLGEMWASHNMGTSMLWIYQYEQAESLYKYSLKLARQLKSNEGVLSNLHALTELKEQTGQFKEAFYYQSDYTHLRDSVHALKANKKITELENLYQVEQQNKQISESQLLIHKHKTQSFIVLVLLVLLSATLIVIYIAYRRKKTSVYEIHSSKLNLETVLDAKNKELENQIMVRKIAEESDKLKSAFLANMSHELRTPMNAIIAFSNFLREPDLSEEKKHEYLDHITGAGDSLLRLIDDIIDIAKLEAQQLKISIAPVNISRMLRELKKVYQKLKVKNNFEANLILSLDSAQDYIINTDIIRIKQILSNLIDNAFKYTLKGSIEFGMDVTDDGILFFVSDTGIGIKKEKQDKIFDRFLQIESGLNRKFGGTGLGLAISKNLTELLGGKIWVESEPERGSRFNILIPANGLRTVDNVPDLSSNGKAKNTKNYNWNNKTILVAEDEELNYRVLSSCLKKTQVRVLRANDGNEAVNICKTEQIDVILMDIQMPVMDGYEATQQIKSFIDIPIIAQTSFAMANEKERCFVAGCDDYITKPIDLDLLLNSIDTYMH